MFQEFRESNTTRESVFNNIMEGNSKIIGKMLQANLISPLKRKAMKIQRVQKSKISKYLLYRPQSSNFVVYTPNTKNFEFLPQSMQVFIFDFERREESSIGKSIKPKHKEESNFKFSPFIVIDIKEKLK